MNKAKKSGGAKSSSSSSRAKAANEKKKKKKEPVEVEDEYDDDFEEYEETVLQAPAMPKQRVSSIPAKAPPPAALEDDVEAIQESVKLENAGTAERASRLAAAEIANKAVPKDEPIEEKKTKKSAKGRPRTARLRVEGLDPRVARAKRVREQLTLTPERFLAFEQPPTTSYQWYRVRMRSKGAPQREYGCGPADDRRTVDVETEGLEQRDVEMQFALGHDDASLENLVRGRSVSFEAPSTRRLAAFARHVGPVIEALLEEETRDEEAGEIFADEKWRRLAEGAGAVFSRARPSTIFVWSDTRGGDLISVWDATTQRRVLVGPGRVTCVCGPPSPRSAPAVAAGTDGGYVMIWDLRDAAPEPAYNTACLAGTPVAHRDALVAVEAVPRGGFFFELVSIDAAGFACLWDVTKAKEKDDDDDDDETVYDLGAKPGAKIILRLAKACIIWAGVPTKLFFPGDEEDEGMLVTHPAVDVDLETTPADEANPAPPRALAVCAATIDATNPDDLFVGLSRPGHVVRCSFGGPTPVPPLAYCAPVYDPNTVVDDDALSRVTALALSIPDLILVGQLDGDIRLHKLDRPDPVLTFDSKGTVAAQDDDDDDDSIPTPVSDVKWSSHRPSVFFALYAHGRLLVFDLLKKTPLLHVDDVARDLGIQVDPPRMRPSLALASGKNALSSKMIAVSLATTVYLRRLATPLTTPQHDERNKLHAALSSIARPSNDDDHVAHDVAGDDDPKSDRVAQDVSDDDHKGDGVDHKGD